MKKVTCEQGLCFGMAGRGGVAKTIAAVLALCMIPGALLAAPVSSKQAETAVRQWISRNPAPLGAKVGKTVNPAKTFTNEANEPLFHVIPLAEGGFIVTSADTKIEPIVAFSGEKTFDADPQNPLYSVLMNDMSLRKKAIGPDFSAALSSTTDLSESEQKWAALLAEPNKQLEFTSVEVVNDMRIAPLVKTKWSQGTVNGKAVYNYYTPKGPDDSPNNYVCGCVATAMAQLMKFHRYPTAAVPARTFACEVENVARSLKMKGGTYDWDAMPFEPGASITDAQRQAVGKICYDAGVSVEMSYDITGSGAFTANVPGSLKSNYNYASAFYTSSDAEQTIQKTVLANLDCGYPVQLAINGASGGHSILADGYGYTGTTRYIHMNMGWGGSDDVWYTLPSMSEELGFTTLTLICYNIFPDSEKKLLSGRVLTVKGSPVEGASVMIHDSNGELIATQTTNAKGMYSYAMNGTSPSEVLTLLVTDGSVTNNPETVVLPRSTLTKVGNLWGQDLVLDVPDVAFEVIVEPSTTAGGLTLGGGSFTPGAPCTIVAIPSPGYLFVNWTQDGTIISTEATYSFNVDNNWVLTANFELEDIPLSEALNTPNLTWETTTGTTKWYGQSVKTHDGVSAARSGAIGNNRETVMQTTVTGTGELTFWWAVSSEAGYDFLKFYIDDVEQEGSISGDVAWQQKTFTIMDLGSHTFKWVYAKDVSAFMGSDCGWVDEVVWDPFTMYTITTVCSPSTGGTITGGGTFRCDSVNTITATPKKGYVFVNWKDPEGNVISTSPSYTFTLTGDQTLTASFVPDGVALKAALDTDAYTFTSTGDGAAGWFGQNTTKHTGTSAAQSGPIGHAQSSTLQTTVTGSGTISFWWKVSSQADHDFLTFYIDDVPQLGAISGNVNWNQKSFAIPTGTHTLKWVYSKDEAGIAGSDCAWVDQITWSPVVHTYTIKTASGPKAGGTTTGDGKYNIGSPCTITATANSGYAFANWKDAFGSVFATTASHTFTIDSDQSLTASFVPTGTSLQSATDTTALTFITRGDGTDWFGQSTTKKYGASAAQSGPIGHGQSSIMEATVVGPGTISFWWKASSESAFDLLKFYIDSTLQYGSISGSTDWLKKTFTIPSGTHTVKWVYSKNATGSIGSDCAWVDQITWVSAIATITTSPLTEEGGTTTGDTTTTVGTTCTVTAQPSEGYAFSAWKENGVTVSTAPAYTFTVLQSRVLTAAFRPIGEDAPYIIPYELDDVLTTAGTYEGYIYAGEADSPDYPIALEGLLSITLSKASGSLSAKATLKTGTVSFSKKSWDWVDPDGTFWVGIEAKTGEYLELGIRQNRIIGTIEGGKAGNTLLTIEGARNRFADKKDLSAQTFLADLTGYYTTLIEPPTDATATFGSLGNQNTGYGYLTLTIGAAGSAKFAGKLADGTALSASGKLIWYSVDGKLCAPLFIPLYSKKGSLGGLVWLDPDTRQIETTLTWVKDGIEPGFDNFRASIDLFGGWYNKKTTAWNASYSMDFTLHAMGTSYYSSGVWASLMCGDNLSELPVAMTAKGAMALPKGSAPARYGKGTQADPYWYDYNDQSPMTTLSFTPSTGLFKGTSKAYYDYWNASGKLTHKAISIPFAGVMLQQNGRITAGAGANQSTETDPALKALKLKWSGPVVIR